MHPHAHFILPHAYPASPSDMIALPTHLSLVNGWASAGGWRPAPDMLIEQPDVSREDAFLRVDRLLEGTQTIGSCCRLSEGIILAARHSISQPNVVSVFSKCAE